MVECSLDQSDVPHSVVVHRSNDGEEMETHAIGLKRHRVPSPSPPTSPRQSIRVPIENRYQTLTSTEDPDMLDTPCIQGASKKVTRPLQKVKDKTHKTPHKKIVLNHSSSTVRPAKKASKEK